MERNSDGEIQSTYKERSNEKKRLRDNETDRDKRAESRGDREGGGGG